MQMGLFSRKKKDAEPDYQKVMQEVYAPKISANPEPWFKKYAIEFPPKAIFERTITIQPNGWFNVEVASMQISTVIPSACEACSADNNSNVMCAECGKSPENFTTVMTANADGDYLGWELYSSEDLISRKLSDGFFVPFDKSIDFNFDGNRLNFVSQKLAPILVTELSVKPYFDDIGMLYFADAFATLDGNDYISGIRVPAGKYSVIAWIGYTLEGEFSPMAVTVLGENFVRNLDFDISTLNEASENVRKCITDSISGTVLARFGADLWGLAQENGNFYSQMQDLESNVADSWGLQYLYREDKDGYFQIEKDYLQEIVGSLWLVECFRIRGQQKIALEKLKQIENKISNLDNSEESNFYRSIYENQKRFPPGTHAILCLSSIPANELGTAEELNNEGWSLYEKGNKEEGLELLKQAAMLGQPNALANYTWFALKEGKFSQAVELHEAAIELVKKSNDSYMITNCKGNYALNLAALGRIDSAIKVSEDCLDSQLYEIHFFLALMYFEKGDFEAAKKVFRMIPKSSHGSVKKTLTEEFSEGSGWFSDWCGKGISAFKELSAS